MELKRCCSLLFLLALSPTLYAIQFNSFDPRSMAMGGVVVATAHANQAASFNPALLANHKEAVIINLPTIGARVNDRDKVASEIKDFWDQKPVEQLTTLINTYNNNPFDVNNINRVADASRALDNSIEGISNKLVQAEAGANLTVIIPGDKIVTALSITNWATSAAIIYSRDQQELTDLAIEISTFSNCQLDTTCDPTQLNLTYIDSNGRIGYDPERDINSNAHARGINLLELAIPFAYHLSDYSANIGISPKYVVASLFECNESVDIFKGEFTLNGHTTTKRNFNLDLGISKQVVLTTGPEWLQRGTLKGGMVVKNLLTQEYRSMMGNVVTLEPQVRAGIGLELTPITLAVDIDLSRNNPIAMEEPSQFLALGVEWQAFSAGALRIGYRHDQLDSQRDSFSAGIGLAPFGNQLDLAVVSNSDRSDYGVALQFALHY